MKKTFYKSINSHCIKLFAIGLLLVNTTSQATSLALPQNFPDFFIDTLDISFVFDGDGGTLTISGDPNSFTSISRGQVNPIFASALPGPTDSFDLIASIDGAGNILSGSVNISGNVHDALNLPAVLYSGNLLSGDLDLFGFSGSGTGTGIIEFTFDNISGVIPDAFGPFSHGGTIISLQNSTLADVDVDLLTTSWTGSGIADAFVPIPAAFWLFGSGVLGLLATSRQRNKQ